MRAHMMGVYQTRNGRWGYSIQRNGHRIRKTVGTKKEAEEAYQAAKSRAVKATCNTKLHDWSLSCIKSLANQRSVNTLKSYRTSLSNLNRHFGNIPLDQITSEDVVLYRDRRLEFIKASSINRELDFLSLCYKLAIRSELVLKNPCKGMKLEEAPGKLRFLTVKEIAELLRATSDPMKGIIELAIYSGMRMREIFGLTWPDVRENVVFVKRKWKGEEYQALRVSDRAIQAIRRQPEASAFVFPNDAGERRRSCRTAFASAVRRAGLKDVTFHTLRHTFASHAVMNGMPLRVLQEILGHTKLDMVLKYAHLADDHVGQVLEGVSRDLSAKIEAEVAESVRKSRNAAPPEKT